MSERVLLLSYGFPPMASPEAYLSAKTMGNLPTTKCDVIAARPSRAWMGNDRSMDSYLSDRFGVVSRVAQPLLARRFPYRFAPALAQLPDVFRWSNGGVRRRLRKLPLDDYRAFVTWGQKHSMHLVGRWLKRERPQTPWIAHFSDPWIDNPFEKYSVWTRRVNVRMEREVVTAADRLVFTTEETRALVMRKYAPDVRDRARVIPHPFDPDLIPRPTKRERGPLILRYTGAFYGIRTPEPLFAGLARLAVQDPGLIRDVRFELIGQVPARDLRSPSFRSLPAGLVIIRPAVDYVPSLQLVADADALVVIDAPSQLSVFLPSKLVDYLGANRPILGIVPPGASERLLREAGQRVADPGDPEAVAGALRETIVELRAGKARAPPARLRDRYSAQVVGRQMQELVDDVAEQAPRGREAKRLERP